ncbi:MAG: multidrug ABC transporter ATP-binding protein, partial [Clostridia bacterium]|nr:multidrug ABC transporter ATP-binding protein [Clostridia bacterium]
MQKKVNLLLLDEPTNHLDVESREALEDALTQFEGTIIAVSHDRYFIKKLSTRILDFQGEKMPPDKRVFLFNGGYDAYLSYKAEENSRAFPEEQMPADPKKPEKAQNERYRAGKEERRRAARIRTLESEIEKNEEALKQIEEQFVEKASDYLALEELCRRQEELKKESDALWEELTRLSEE